MSPIRLTLTMVLTFAPACSRAVATAPPASPRAELAFDGLALRIYRRGAPLLLLRSSHLELMRSSGELVARDARFDFFVEALTLDAPRLSGNLDTLSFDATGAVRFASSGSDPSSRFVATTPSAHFEGKQGARGVATGAEPIAVRGLRGGHPFSLEAGRFRFDVDAQHATFEAVQSQVGPP